MSRRRTSIATALGRLADERHAVTTEFENVPAARSATGAPAPVAPSGAAVAVCQDRAAEKAQFVRCGVPCAPHAVIERAEQLGALDADACCPAS
jgi:5-(carboxyamino)imidazole ribonucleotide synthase